MDRNIDYKTARGLLLRNVLPVGTEKLPLEQCSGRILAGTLEAAENIPPFDRSPYDGYAFRAEDSKDASKETPVVLSITETIAAGGVPTKPVTEGMAAKILTGAPIPTGADAVVMFEKTRFTEKTVTLFSPAEKGQNIIRAGDDVRAGNVLAEAGTIIDPGLAGTLASQGAEAPRVYRKPRVGIISTGNELVEPGEPLTEGKIRNSNRYTLTSALQADGCTAVYIGSAEDREPDIAQLIEKGLESCDMLLLTGGVSVGDYDCTPAAMEQAGAEILARGVDLKPGMACAYGVKDGKLICALSGNPASAITNYFAVVRPAVYRLAGRADCLPDEFDVELAGSFGKGSKKTRLLRGRLFFEDGRAKMRLPQEQGNVVLSSTIGCNVMAIVPAGSGPLSTGTMLKGFLI